MPGRNALFIPCPTNMPDAIRVAMIYKPSRLTLIGP